MTRFARANQSSAPPATRSPTCCRGRLPVQAFRLVIGRTEAAERPPDLNGKLIPNDGQERSPPPVTHLPRRIVSSRHDTRTRVPCRKSGPRTGRAVRQHLAPGVQHGRTHTRAFHGCNRGFDRARTYDARGGFLYQISVIIHSFYFLYHQSKMLGTFDDSQGLRRARTRKRK